MGFAAMAQERDKWPFDPMQPGDHEPVRIPDDHPARADDDPAKKQQPQKEPQ